MSRPFHTDHLQLYGSSLATVLSGIWALSGGGIEALIAIITSLTLLAVTIVKERTTLAQKLKLVSIWIGNRLMFDERRLLANSSTSVISGKELGQTLARFDFYTKRLKQLTMLIAVVWVGLNLYIYRSMIISTMTNVIGENSVKTDSKATKGKTQTDKKNPSHDKKSEVPNNSINEQKEKSEKSIEEDSNEIEPSVVKRIYNLLIVFILGLVVYVGPPAIVCYLGYVFIHSLQSVSVKRRLSSFLEREDFDGALSELDAVFSNYEFRDLQVYEFVRDNFTKCLLRNLRYRQ